MLETVKTEKQKLHLAGDRITQSHTLLHEALRKGSDSPTFDEGKTGGLSLVLGNVVNKKKSSSTLPISNQVPLVPGRL